MVKHTQTIRRLFAMNSLSVFDHFVGLALKGLKLSMQGMYYTGCFHIPFEVFQHLTLLIYSKPCIF